MKEILKLDHIQKYYGNSGNVTKAIQDISFSVQEGEFVGIMGASAGGHLASTLATHYSAASRPDFQILLYPVVTMTQSTHGGSRKELLGGNPTAEQEVLFSNELQVTSDTPQAFILSLIHI